MLLATTFENYAPGDIEPELGPKELNPKDSLLMDEEQSSQKRRKKGHGSKSRRSKNTSSSVEKPGWNERFWVDSVVNNDAQTHPHFKVTNLR